VSKLILHQSNSMVFKCLPSAARKAGCDTRGRRGRYHDATVLTPTLTSARKDPYAILFRVPKTNDNVARTSSLPTISGKMIAPSWGITTSPQPATVADQNFFRVNLGLIGDAPAVTTSIDLHVHFLAKVMSDYNDTRYEFLNTWANAR